ncbi:MAG: hypothetical protein ACLTYN_05375 [Dysosmobacter welbionis]
MVIQLAREQHMSIIFISSEIDEMTAPAHAWQSCGTGGRWRN